MLSRERQRAALQAIGWMTAASGVAQALAVAAFDLASAVLIVTYRQATPN